MKLLIAGDLSLQDRAATCPWSESQLLGSFSSVRSIITKCDHAIVNLESPITYNNKSILKDGPSLRNPRKAIKIVKYCGFNEVTLANNHLMDYGEQGVKDTIKACNEHGILTVGAGENLSEARKALLLRKDDFSLGLLNVCEHESSIATDESAGAAPLEFADLYYDIKDLRKEVDKVIVIIHGGCEHYQLPTPRMKRDYHLIIDFGADIIVNHHQHCYSGYEVYNGKPIFYGLGNFFFDNPHKRHDKWNEGMALKLEITKDDTCFEMIPFIQCDEEPVIKIKEYEDVNDSIAQLNTIIADDKLLVEYFNQLVSSKKPLYPVLPYGNHYLRALYTRGYLPDSISKQNKALIENVINCETHREILLHYLNNHLHKDTL